MKVRDFLKKLSKSEDVTFIKARAREDANTPFYHAEYQTTPIWSVQDWLNDGNSKLLDSVVLNDHQMPIDWLSGARWDNRVRNGLLKCLLVISQEDFALLFVSKEQRDSMEKHCEERFFYSVK